MYISVCLITNIIITSIRKHCVIRRSAVFRPKSELTPVVVGFQVLAGDERLGLRRGAGVRPDEPMDTIFVKNVREHGPASAAGLSTGDRIISVNGETVAGKSYAHVVQVIQQSQCYLYLLVVPMENDILQLVSIVYNVLYTCTCS